MIKKIFLLILSIIFTINCCITPSFAEDLNIFEKNFSVKNNQNHYTLLSLSEKNKKQNELYIMNGNNELSYFENEHSGELIDGLDVSYDESTSTYIINVTKDVTITSNNEDAISSREGDNLKIIGNHTLTINLNLDGNNHEYTYGIYSTNHLQIGDQNSNDRLKIVINDTYIMNNHSESSTINSYSYALCADNGIDIYNSDIDANITSFFAYANDDDINIYNSKLNHNIFAYYTLPSFVDEEDLNYFTCEFSTLYTEDAKIYVNNNCEINSSFINFSEKSEIFYTAFASDDIEIIESKIDLCAYAYNDGIDEYMVPEFFQAAIITNDECSIKESDIKIRNFYYGIAAQFNLEIINSNIDQINYSSCLYTAGVLSISYDDNSRYKFDIYATNEGEIDISELQVLPAIVVYKVVGENVYYVPTNENLIISLPSETYLTTDIDEIYILNNNNSYRNISLKYLHEPIVDFDLSVCDTKYKKNDIVDGSSIDNLDISFENGTYTINVLNDLELTAYDESAIICNNFDLKIIGDGKLTFNMKNYDTSVENYCYAVIADGNLQIGELNSNDKLYFEINDDFSMDNDNKEILNSYSYGLKADDDIYIYNTKIIGNITCDLICSNYKNINIYNSELIHNIHANYKYPGIYRNESGVDFVSLYAEDDITINNNSSIKTAFVDYIPESCIFYNGIECDNFIMNDSLLDLNNSYDLDTEQGKLNSNAISTCSFEASNSDIRINDFLFGIIGESLSFVNTNVNMRNYGSCLISILKVLIKFDSDKYNFNIVATNTGDISFEDGILPVITFFDGENLFVPDENILIFDLPDTLKVSTDLDDLFDITKNNTYRQINIVKTQTDNPDNPPYNPSHYVVPKTGIK